ncbi:MAG: protein kinase [Clostridiales bacterium]|nr:protein kinase [Clostridiales bacterium]
MNKIQRAVEEISAAFRPGYPAEFLERYEPVECLASRRGTETLLVRERVGGALFVSKVYDRALYPSAPESDILRSLGRGDFPAFVGEFRDAGTICIVREYVDGVPLDRYVAERAPSAAEILGIAAQICDILTFLHGQNPPIIHRDIKPQNIIVTASGAIRLIDFDIARTYDQEAETDTRVIGTRAYAPPEQFGFSQTDGRADIYSLGVLLRWMLSGTADARRAVIPDRALAAIVRRATEFSPDNRYPSAAAMKRHLLSADSRRRKRPLRALAAAALLVAALAAGFFVGRYTGAFAPGGVRFREPLIEEAVRLQLGKGAGEELTAADLLNVRAIYIFASEVSLSEAAFADGLSGERANAARGPIASIEDVKLLPNLECLYINHQQLADIAPAAELKNLTEVNLRHTRVADISALAGMEKLQVVNLYDTDVEDAAALDMCPRLSRLEVGQTLIASLDGIGGAATLESLSLSGLKLTSLNGIERFAYLRDIHLAQTGFADLSPLLSLPRLQTVRIDESMRAAAEAIAGGAAFAFTY